MHHNNENHVLCVQCANLSGQAYIKPEKRSQVKSEDKLEDMERYLTCIKLKKALFLFNSIKQSIETDDHWL